MAKLKDFPYCSELRDNPDLADWECGPCGETCDSDALERANFLHAYNVLETMESDDFMVVTWNHWACGWVSEIFTRPGSKANELAKAMYESMLDADLNEDLWAQFEMEDEINTGNSHNDNEEE